MSYTQSFNESMTKDDREDAERRMATVRPVTAGIASKAVINAQSRMTKDEREALETATRQISPSAQLSSSAPVAQSPYPSASYGGPSGSGYVQPAVAQSRMTKDDREDAERRMATVKPVTAGIASKAVINAQSNKSKEDREISNAYKTPGYVQPVYASQVRPPATYTPIPNVITASPVIIPGTKDAREAAPDWVKLALQVGAAYLLLA